MYRSFPFLFSLLVYASPVIVSTAVLLGTLLFFGHQNLPPKPHHHHIHINRKTVVMGDTEVDESSSCEETHSSSKVLENTFKGKTCVVNNNNNIKVNVDHSNNNNIIHIDKKGSSVDDSDSKQSRKETKNIVDNQEKNKNVGGERVVLLDHFSQHNLLPDAAKNSKLKSSDKLQGNSLLWQCGEKHKKDEDNKGWETGSELAESSSPSALMADIFPMLAQVPQHTHLSNVGTDVASDHSLDSTDVINETDDDDDDDDDDEEDIQVKDDEEEEEEEANMETEDETTWTENDQKNLLVNLGTSEVERNQRLETLIARQRALKNMRIMAEKNMVNLSPDIPFNATLTTRKNPLGLPYDPNAHILGPPSSVTRNHPSGEKQPDTQEPNLHNESCDVVDPSTSHYSVHERMVAPDYSSSMHRQTSEVSDSKVSSTPDTESTVDSADDLENKNHTKYDFSREADLTCVKDHYHTTKESEHVNRSSSDDDTEDGRLDEVKTSVMDEADNQEKTSSNWSSSPLSDVTDHVYDEKEGEKTLESNYHTENSHKIQMDISKRHQSPPTTTTRNAEDQHLIAPDNNNNKKEQQPTVTSPPHNATQPEEMSLENPLTHDSNEELQIQEQQVSPNNNSASSTFEDKISSGMGTNTPASPEYESNVNRIDSNHEKNDDISDIGDSSVYESGFDSDTDRSENANTEFASASESEMSRTNESRFPQRLSRVQQDLTSWLTGWRV
ncbi:hypothetical protein L6452_28931 [Arctium lappa]|uniref:Uncharacterized protein n=1 Tax=Arctium lappa TaxID=4217 RepID=A0ACB8ZEV8_ARCLA|nr:hypothetical protein L6452_28931 [Arctium lappa]